MLTAAIGAAPGTIDAAYDVERMYEYLDYVHGELMWVVGIRVHPLFGPFKLPGTHSVISLQPKPKSPHIQSMSKGELRTLILIRHL